MNQHWQPSVKVKNEYPYDPNPHIYRPLTPDQIRRFKAFSREYQLVDKGLRNLVMRLNEAGYVTVGSCSGLTADHRVAPQHSYIWFAKTDRKRLEDIVKATEIADLLLIYHGTQSFSFSDEQDKIEFEMIEVRSPRRPKSDDEIRKAWRLFEQSIFGEVIG